MDNANVSAFFVTALQRSSGTITIAGLKVGEIERRGIRNFHAYPLVMPMDGVHQQQKPGDQDAR